MIAYFIDFLELCPSNSQWKSRYMYQPRNSLGYRPAVAQFSARNTGQERVWISFPHAYIAASMSKFQVHITSLWSICMHSAALYHTTSLHSTYIVAKIMYNVVCTIAGLYGMWITTHTAALLVESLLFVNCDIRPNQHYVQCCMHNQSE